MELIAVATLAILGYEMKGRTPRGKGEKRRKIRRTMFYDDEEPVAPEILAPPRENLNPHIHSASAPYHNNMVPFFGSQGAQNTNDNVKQSRLETFTGNDANFHRKKREVVAMINPEESKTTIHGAPAMTDEERLRPFSASSFYNNVNSDPHTNQRVGPGLGIGTSVASAGGFHPESVLRVLPENINEHRKNQLDSLQANPGKFSVEKITEDVGESVRTIVPRFYEESQHPTLPTGGVNLRQTSFGDHDLKDTRRGEMHELGSGAAPSLPVESRSGLLTDYEPRTGRLIDSCHRSPMPANNMGHTSRETSYFLPDNDREKCTPICNLVGLPAEVSREAWDAKTTLRQCAPCTPMAGPAGTTVSAVTSSVGIGSEGRMGRQILPNYNQYQNYDGRTGTYVPLENHTCKNQKLGQCSAPVPSFTKGGHTKYLSEFDMSGGGLDFETDYHFTHGQGPSNVVVDPNAYELRGDDLYERSPHQGRVYVQRADLGEVELR